MQQFWSMSRRYRYAPRMTAGQLSQAMNRLDLTGGQLARISGANVDRVHRWLKGQDDIPPYVQRDLDVWQKSEEAFRLSWEWADEHAHDVRTDDDA